MKAINLRLCIFCFSPQQLLNLCLNKAKAVLRQCLFDIEQENNLSAVIKLSLWYSCFPTSSLNTVASYLQELASPKYRRAFLSGWLMSFVQQYLRAITRKRKNSLQKRICPNGDSSLASVVHVLLFCSWTEIYIKSSSHCYYCLSQDVAQDVLVTRKTAKLLGTGIKIRVTTMHWVSNSIIFKF